MHRPKGRRIVQLRERRLILKAFRTYSGVAFAISQSRAAIARSAREACIYITCRQTRRRYVSLVGAMPMCKAINVHRCVNRDKQLVYNYYVQVYRGRRKEV